MFLWNSHRAALKDGAGAIPISQMRKPSPEVTQLMQSWGSTWAQQLTFFLSALVPPFARGPLRQALLQPSACVFRNPYDGPERWVTHFLPQFRGRGRGAVWEAGRSSKLIWNLAGFQVGSPRV